MTIERSRTEELFRAVSEHVTNISIVLLDRDGHVVSWTNGAQRIEGYTAPEILGQHFSVFAPQADRPMMHALLEEAARTGHMTAEGWRVRADGSQYWAGIELTAVRDGDGTLTGFVRVARDISNQHQAHEEMRQSDARYRHLIDSATEIIFTHGLDGVLLSVNAAAERLLGYTPEEAIGRPISDFIAPEHHERAISMTHKKLQHGGSTTYLLDVVARSGKQYTLELSTHIIYASDSTPVAVQGIGRDVTKRQRATDLLERSERYFRALIEHAADAITIINEDGSVRYSSPAITRIIGFTPDERRGLPVFKIVHPEDVAEALTVFQNLRQDPGGSADRVMRAIHRDGSTRHIHLRVRNLISDPDVQGMVINWRDITDQIVAEERLKAREHFFRSIIERSADLHVVTDADIRVLYISPAIHSILGYSADEIVGNIAFQFVVPEDVERTRDFARDLLENPDTLATIALRARARDGTIRHLDVRARNLLADPIVQGIVVNVRDVTASQRVEQALRSSEERFRKIIETAGEGIGIRDATGRLTFVNDRLVAMTGYSEDELLSHDVSEFVAPEYRQALAESTQRRRLTAQPESLDIEMIRKDGSRLPAILSANPLFDDDGEYIGALGMLTDMTERQRLEDQLRQSQKIEAVGRLAGGIAHDFNNLLTAIRGHVDLVLTDIGSENALYGDIQEIASAADRAAALTQQLLAFSRRQILQPRVLDLDGVVKGIESMVRRLIGEDVRFMTKLGAQGARVRADRSQIEQVLINLVVNARDAMPNGGSCTVETGVVELDAEFARAHAGAKPGKHVRLSVVDSGVGMDEETLSHVFEPFFTTKEVGKGTGLGLATVWGIVQQSGGYLRLTSGQATGTNFEIFLPVVQDVPVVANDMKDPGSIEARGETVLLAEDEAAVRSLACRILRKRGYTVLEASNGVEALEVVRSHEGAIDLLLTDVVMPSLGGRELREQLLEIIPGTKVLFMSGYTDDALIQRGVSQGVSFLEKPFTPHGLAVKVREVLDET